VNFHRYPVFAACPRELLREGTLGNCFWLVVLFGAAQKFRTSCAALISSCLLRLRKTRLPPESPSYHLDFRGNAISDCPKRFAKNPKIHYSSARPYVCSLRNSCCDFLLVQIGNGSPNSLPLVSLCSALFQMEQTGGLQ
jgi:hypothetical protein